MIDGSIDYLFPSVLMYLARLSSVSGELLDFSNSGGTCIELMIAVYASISLSNSLIAYLFCFLISEMNDLVYAEDDLLFFARRVLVYGIGGNGFFFGGGFFTNGEGL